MSNDIEIGDPFDNPHVYPMQITGTKEELATIEDHPEIRAYDYALGMRLSDHLAGLAMQSMSSPQWPSDAEWPEIARRSYVAAEAMLAERKRRLA